MAKDKESTENPQNDVEGGSAPVASKKTPGVLTAVAGVVKEKYQPIYGLKNILSAGLLLFELTKADLRVEVIRFANGEITRDEFYDAMIRLRGLRQGYAEMRRAVNQLSSEELVQRLDEIYSTSGDAAVAV